MSQLVDILNALENTLAVERELGVTTLEIDPTVLRPNQPPPPVPPAPAASPRPAASAAPQVSPAAPAPVSRQPVAAPSAVNTSSKPAPKENSHNAATARKTGEEYILEGNLSSPSFMLVTEDFTLPAAEVLFSKMVAAMGCGPDDICRVKVKSSGKGRETGTPILDVAVKDVKPKVIVLFGSAVLHSLFPDRKIRRNVWELFSGVPVIVTNSPQHIEKFNVKNNEEATREAKQAVWKVLLAALAKMGRKPPSAKK